MEVKLSSGELIPITISDGPSACMIRCVCGGVFSASAATSKALEKKRQRWSRKHEHCEKQPYEAKVFWLSFCDSELPEGSQFLGACIVAVTPAEVEDAYIETLLRCPMAQPGAEYIAAAIKKAHALGCNPGGEVASHEIPIDHPNLALYTFGVLMDRARIEAIDALIDARK